MENYLETNEFLQNLFSNFPNWITNWEINQVSNGGKAPAKDPSLNELNSIFPLNGKSVLEMAPQEAKHTKMMHDFGAKKIIGLEGRLENYIKCCVLKNIFNLKNAKFYVEDLQKCDLKKFGFFDLCFCSGLLYHVYNPQEIISKISEIASSVFIASNYAYDDYPKNEYSEVSLGDKKYKGKTNEEVNPGFSGAALQKNEFWLTKDSFVEVLKDVGFKKVKVM